MMRRQVYEWRGIVPAQTSPNPFTLNLHPILTINPLIPQFTANRNEGVEIFVGGYGSNLDIPAFVTAEQFIGLLLLPANYGLISSYISKIQMGPPKHPEETTSVFMVIHHHLDLLLELNLSHSVGCKVGH